MTEGKRWAALTGKTYHLAPLLAVLAARPLWATRA